MEMEHNPEDGSHHAWWLENTHRLHQSQWLQSTMSDLDTKIKKMLSLIEDDGDTFAKRAEMFYKKRPMLIECVEDLHGSYKSLAEKYNQLNRSDKLRALPVFEKPNWFPAKLQGSDHDNDHDETSDLDFEFARFDDCQKGWNELESNMIKLVQDNLEQQAELVKRNDEKREAINMLRTHVRKLVAENNELKGNYTKTPDIKRSRSQISRAKDVILKKIMPESRC